MFHVAKNNTYSRRAIVSFVAQIVILSCQPFVLAATVTWDDGAIDIPNVQGDGISWGDKFNWDPDMVPTGVDDVSLTTDLVKVQDGNVAFAATLDAGTTDLEIDGSLTVFGSFDNDVTITVVSDDDAPTSGASFRVGEGSTLDGEGEVLLRRTSSLGVAPATFGSTGNVAVTHGAAHTIRGEGVLSANLINNGLIKAENLDGNPSSILALGNTLQNNSVVRTSPSAGIRIEGNLTQSGSGQTIADANVVEYRLGVISGGTLQAENGGSFLFPVDGTISSLTNNAPINVVTGTTAIDLFVTGTGLANNGTITINSNDMNGSCIITFQTTQTLDGNGEIVLNHWNTNGSPGATLFTQVGATVTQAAGHTIRGEGLMTTSLVNDGLVEAMDANGDGEGLLRVTSNINGSAHPTNNNIYRAAENGVIDLNGQLDQSTTGRLIAANGRVVQLRGTVAGGSLETEGTGVIELVSGSTLVNVTNKGSINIPGGGSEKLLMLRGNSFTNDGVVTVNSTGTNGASLRAEESVEIGGSGEILLPLAAIFQSRFSIQAGVVVTQNAGHSIHGRGGIDGTSGTLVNNGTLAGESSTELLDVNSILMGDGLVRDVFIDGIHSPGNPQTGSPTASVPIEGEYNFGNGFGINGDNRLVIEIGGTTPGTEYDQLVSTDPTNQFTIRTFGTVLDVSLIDLGNGYEPVAGDRFTIIDSPNDITGMFQSVLLPDFGLGKSLTWLPVDFSDPTKLVLEIASVTDFFFEADFDEDGDVDGDDLTRWQTGYSLAATATHGDGDADADGDVDGRDFLVWQRQFGNGVPLVASVAVPEPNAVLLSLVGLFVLSTRSNRRQC